MFKHLSYSRKIMLLLGMLSLLSILIITVTSNVTLTSYLERHACEELQRINDSTHDLIRTSANTSIRNYLRAGADKSKHLIAYYYQQFQNKEITETQAFTSIKDIFLNSEFGKIGETGYVCCVNGKGKIEIHPFSEGIDAGGFDFVQQAVKMKEGYLEYTWKNVDETKARDKAAYITYFEPWDLIVWVSSYKEEFGRLVNVKDFEKSILNIQVGQTGYIYVLDSKGTLIIHPQLQGTNIYNHQDSNGNYFIQEICRKKNGQIIYPWKNPGEVEAREKIVIYKYLPEMDWIICSGIYLDELYEPVSKFQQTILLLSIIILIVAIALSVIISHLISKPLRQLQHYAELVGKGNLEIQIPVTGSDEIGYLANSFNQMVKNLNLSKENYRSLVNNLNVGVYRSEPGLDAKFVNANLAMARIFEFDSVEELMQKKVTDLYVTPNERVEMLQKEQSSGIAKDYEIAMLTKSGKQIWVSVNETWVYDKNNELVYLDGILEDITQQKKVQDSLHRLKKAVETMELGVTLTDLQQNIIYINPANAKMHGYSPEELIGKTANVFVYDYEKNSLMAQNKPIASWRRESFDLKKDGTTFPVFLMSDVVRNENGEPIGYVTTCQDISDRKKLEHELELHRKNLESLVEERTRKLIETSDYLDKAQDQLIESEKLATLGHLIAGVAHEINTPLGAIRSSIGNIEGTLDQTISILPAFFRKIPESLLSTFFGLIKNSLQKDLSITSREERKFRRQLVNNLDELKIEKADLIADMLVDMGVFDHQPCIDLLKHPDALEIVQIAYQLSGLERSSRNIQIAVDRATKVVFALKSFARFDHTQEKFETYIQENIDTVLTLYHNKIKHGIELIKEYESVPMIACYPDELNQVWTNLIHNALQAMDYKGILRIKIDQKNEHVIVAITDSGKGIPEEIRDKIFNPFFTTKPPGEGSGLGLDIVKKIVKKHDGEIYFESAPGKTTFFVSLPMK